MKRVIRVATLWIMRAERIICCAGLALAAAALCADVFSREILGQGIYGVQKFAVYCCAVAGALGLSVVVHSGGHLRVTAIDALIPQRFLGIVACIGDVISALACLFLAYYAQQFVYNTFRFQEMDTILQIPIWWVQIVLPVAFALAALKYLLHAIDPASKPEESMV